MTENKPTAQELYNRYTEDLGDVLKGAHYTVAKECLRQFYTDLENNGFLQEDTTHKDVTEEYVETIKDELNKALVEEFGKTGFKFNVSLFIPEKEFAFILEPEDSSVIRSVGSIILTQEAYNFIHNKLRKLVNGIVRAKHNKFYVFFG